MAFGLIVAIAGVTLSVPLASAEADDGIGPTGSATDDAGYVTLLEQYFGVSSSASQLTSLLDSPIWGTPVRDMADLAKYGDTFVHPSDLGSDTEINLINTLLAQIGDIPLSHLPDTVSKILAVKGYADDIYAAEGATGVSGNSVLDQLGRFYDISTAYDVVTQITGGADRFSGAFNDLEQAQTYANLAIVPSKEAEWRELVSEYQSVWDSDCTALCEVNKLYAGDDTGAVWGPKMDNLLSGNIFVPPQFSDKTHLGVALEQAYQGIQYASNPEAQGQVGLFIDFLAETQAYGGLIAVQTGPFTVTLLNNGGSQLSDIELSSGGNVFASDSTLAAHAQDELSIPLSDPLASGGTISFSVNGSLPISQDLSSVVQEAWVSTATKSLTASKTYQFGTTHLILGSTASISGHWDFGDGYSSNDLNPTHTYACPGTFTASFALTSSDGSKLPTVTTPITISSGYSFDWSMDGSVDPIAVAPGVPVSFASSGIDLSSGGSVSWDFGDSTIFQSSTATGKTASHTYSAAAVHNVSARYMDPDNCPTTITKPISVGTSTDWVQLPTSDVTGQVKLSSAVAGYWSDSTVVIEPGASLTFEGPVQIRSSTPLLFNVKGTLTIPGGRITNSGDPTAAQPPNDSERVAAGARFQAIYAGVNSTINVSNVEADLMTTFIGSNDAGTSISVSGLIVNNSNQGIAATDFASVKIDSSTFNGTSPGVALAGSGFASFDTDIFTGGGIGVAASNYTSFSMVNSTFRQMTYAAELSGRAWGASIVGSIVEGGGAGIFLVGNSSFGVTRLASSLVYEPSGATVSSGSVVELEPGVIVKVQGSCCWSPGVGFVVAGTLRTAGSSSSPVVFAQLTDDSVGGDTNMNGDTPPGGYDAQSAPITLTAAGNVHIDNTHVSGGQYFVVGTPGVSNPWLYWGTGEGDGGSVSITHSVLDSPQVISSTGGLASINIDSSTIRGSIATSGLKTEVSLTNSDLSDAALSIGAGTSAYAVGNRIDSFHVSGVPSGSVTVTDNTLVGGKAISLSDASIGATVLRNVAFDGKGGMVRLSGYIPVGVFHLFSDLPYVPSGVQVQAGALVVFDPGAVVKVDYSGVGFDVAGTVSVAGTASHPVVFTSTVDDSVDGDTNADGATTFSPSSAQWGFTAFTIFDSGHISADHAHSLGGLSFASAIPAQYYWLQGAGSGGSITVTDSELTGIQPINSSANLAALIVNNTIFHGGPVVSSGPTTPVTVTNSDLTDSSLSITAGVSAGIEQNLLSSVTVTNVPSAGVIIANNTLFGGKAIGLANDSIGATVLGNAPADGVGGFVYLSGSAPVGLTHLSADLPYVPAGVQVPAGATLDLDSGDVVKVQSSGYGFDVAGSVKVAGTSATPVTFTSWVDDSVGGDTNLDGATAFDPSSTQWGYSAFTIIDSGQVTADHALMLGGRSLVTAVPPQYYWLPGAGSGGSITVTNSELTGIQPIYSTANVTTISVDSSTLNGSVSSSGSTTKTTVTNSDLSNASLAIGGGAAVDIERDWVNGLSVDGVAADAVNVTDNTLVGSKTIGLANASIGATVLRNSPADGVGGVVRLSGFTPAGVTHLSADLPYIPSGVQVPAGSSVIFDPGVVVKVEYSNVGFAVGGSVDAAGTSDSPVIFTSSVDDSVGGDSNLDGATMFDPSSAQWSFTAFSIVYAGHVVADHVRTLGGQSFVTANPPAYYWLPGAGDGGVITITHSDLSGRQSVYSTANLATVDVTDTELRGGAGITVESAGNTAVDIENDHFASGSIGVALIVSAVDDASIVLRSNDFAGVGTGVSSGTAVDATRNWWGSAAGPSQSGAATASAGLPVRPWCLQAACTTFSPYPATGLNLGTPAIVQIGVGQLVPTVNSNLVADNQTDIEPVTVSLAVTGGLKFDDSTTTKSVQSAPDGTIAIPAIRAGTAPGNAALTITAGSFSTTVNYTVVAGPPASLVGQTGGGEHPVISSTVPGYTAMLSDQYGNPIAGASVSFSVTGAATFSSGPGADVEVTDVTGMVVSPSIIAGGVVGSFSVSAMAGALTETFASGQVVAAPLGTFTSTPTPSVSGSAVVGGTLTVHPGAWAPAPVQLTYQWRRNGSDIDGATGTTYVLASADANAMISIAVTGSADGYQTITETSDPIDLSVQDSYFADVADPTYAFYPYIQWMAISGISTGTGQPAGKPLYKPSVAVSRQAMASFLYKLAATNFAPPSTPTFADVDSSSPFYTAIEWMASQGISTGTAQPTGGPLFKPTDAVSRQAMALFLARYDHVNLVAPPTSQSFADVPITASSAAAIAWMASTGISTGTAQTSGLPTYLPANPVSRSAMAAFLYRLVHLPT